MVCTRRLFCLDCGDISQQKCVSQCCSATYEYTALLVIVYFNTASFYIETEFLNVLLKVFFACVQVAEFTWEC